MTHSKQVMNFSFSIISVFIVLYRSSAKSKTDDHNSTKSYQTSGLHFQVTALQGMERQHVYGMFCSGQLPRAVLPRSQLVI